MILESIELQNNSKIMNLNAYLDFKSEVFLQILDDHNKER